MRGLLGPARGALDRVLVIESGSRESGELVLAHLAHEAGAHGLHVLTCYDSAPAELRRFAAARCFSVHAAEAIQNRRAFAGKLARDSYDAVIVLCTGSGVLAKWKWLLTLQTRSRVVFADEFGDYFFVTLRNPAPLLVMALRRMRIGSVPELLVGVLRLLMVPFVLGFLLLYAITVQGRRLLRRVSATSNLG